MLEKFNGRELIEALLANETLADAFDEKQIWTKLSATSWSHLLIYAPKYASKCKKWKEMKIDEWICLLSRQPQFSDKCKKFKSFKVKDWFELFKSRPEFVNLCPDDIYDKFSKGHWTYLEKKYSSIFEDKHMLSTLRKLAK